MIITYDRQNIFTVQATEDWKKICPNFGKSSLNSCQTKNCDIMLIESSILKSQTSALPPSELFKYIQQTIFSPKNFLDL